MNDSSTQRVTETNRGWLSRRVLILIIVVTLGLAVFALGLREDWGIGAICPKCLQGASITVVKIARIPIIKRTTYSQHIDLSPIWFSRNTSVPVGIHAGMYTEILGKKCDHEWKKGGFGATRRSLLFGQMNKDGAFFQGRLYQPRIEAIAALYCAFKNVPDKSLARMTYARIDAALPMNKEACLQEVHRIQELRESATISDQEIKGIYPTAFPMYHAIEVIKAFPVRLSNVASREEWVNLLHDLDARLQMQSPTE